MKPPLRALHFVHECARGAWGGVQTGRGGLLRIKIHGTVLAAPLVRLRWRTKRFGGVSLTFYEYDSCTSGYPECW